MKRIARKIENLPDEEELWKRPASVEDDQWLHVVFTVDFSKTKKRLRQEFEAWLDLPENRGRLAKYKRDPIGTTGKPKDRLKKLAEWRLYDELRYDKALESARTNRKRDAAGKDRPFHDARQDQSKKVPLNQAPLWTEESSARKAKPRVREYLAEIIPWEFCEKPKSTFLDEFLRNLPRTVKISKRNS